MIQWINLTSLLLAISLLSGCKDKSGGATSGKSEEKVLNLYSWSEYFPPAVLGTFTKRTGIKVHLSVYTTNEELIDKLSSGVSDYDVVVPSDYAVRVLILDKRLMALDRAKLLQFANLDPKQLGLSYDKENQFSIPYLWGTTGIGINKQVITEPVDSWAAMFDPKNAGKISMLNDGRENFVAALKLMGKSINETDPAVLKQAADMLAKQKALVKSYDSDSFDDKLRTGEAALVQGFNGQLAKVVSEKKDKFYYIVPKEGATHWVDNLAISTTAKHPEASMIFLNYILEPEVAAEIVKAVGYASANNAARKFIPAEILDNPNIYPSDEVLKRCEVMEDLGTTAPLIDKLWTQIKAK